MHFLILHSSSKGSPPHTRGKVVIYVFFILYFRITPAHAGKSTVQRRYAPISQDHPRTRGEKPGSPKKSATSPGSPPHTRGKVRHIGRQLAPARITPAHAGKSTFIRCGDTLRRDHPRTRGEKLLQRFMQKFSKGSPPHTRGKAPLVSSLKWGLRITPAHAGKSERGRNRSRTGQDHPRTRGEKA